MTRSRLWTAFVLTQAILSTSTLAAPPEPAPPDLSGRWKLNREASDNTRQKMREGMGKGGGGPMGPGGGSMGPPPGGAAKGPGGPPGQDPGREPGEAFRALFEPAEELTIIQSAVEVQIEALYGDTRFIRPTGKKTKAENGTVERLAEWKDGALCVQTTDKMGQKIKETWALGDDGKRLTIDFRIEGGMGPKISLRRAYDRAEK